MNAPDPLFDRRLYRLRLARAAARPADFLLAHAAEEILGRLATIKRSFARFADVGTPTALLADRLAGGGGQGLHVGPVPGPAQGGVARLVGDVERLPLAPGAFDLVTSAFALQSVDDLPGALVQIRQSLKPDGLFLGVLLGGRTLVELRTVLTEAEIASRGGASPRVAPFADVRDMGGLLQRAGFALPVADSDTLTVRYRDLFGLIADLRAMGATNVLLGRDRRPPPRALFARAAALYAARFADPDGRIRATFEILFVSGWAPHESQQKPARRGSGKVSLATVLPPPKR